MQVKIRHTKDSESIHFANISNPGEIENIVKEMARAGGVIVCRNGNRQIALDPSSQLRYDFILTEKSFYAEIVVHDEPQA